MANEKRIRALAVGGLVEDNPLTSGAPTLTSAGLAALPAIGSTEHAAIVLDPDGDFGAPEIAYVTAHTAAAVSATIARGQEGTTARQHDRDVPWVHAPTPAHDYQQLIAVAAYATGTDVNLAAVTSGTMVDLDAANLKVDFVVPPSGKVLVKLSGAGTVASGAGNGFWGLREGSTTIATTMVFVGGANPTPSRAMLITGLTPGAAKTYKWGAYVTTGQMNNWTGPTYGQHVMEVWAVNA